MKMTILLSKGRLMNKIYHHFKDWEEHQYGMWVSISGERKKILLRRAIRFTGNAKLYGEYMLKALERWPISCEQNLSCHDQNRQAWIGHAATCIAIGCPEEITRLAWHYLTQKQQDDANAVADLAIQKWEEANIYKCTGIKQYNLLELANA